MTIDMTTLQTIAEAILLKFQSISPEDWDTMITIHDYHGFGKSRLPHEFVENILTPYGLTSEQVQIEVVRVTSDLTNEVHYHDKASAYIIGLGQVEHVPDAQGALTYTDKTWVPFATGERVAIPAGMHHGFTVTDGGVLYFLSVQAPPIVDEQGLDDYYKVVA